MTENSKNKIEILCPSKKCRKCTRITNSLLTLLKNENIEAEIIIIDKLEEMLEKHTWILPTIIVNDKIVARGYLPSKEKILKELY
jgi:hypothetical protein